jgi:hypothetical protein
LPFGKTSAYANPPRLVPKKTPWPSFAHAKVVATDDADADDVSKPSSSGAKLLLLLSCEGDDEEGLETTLTLIALFNTQLADRIVPHLCSEPPPPPPPPPALFELLLLVLFSLLLPNSSTFPTLTKNTSTFPARVNTSKVLSLCDADIDSSSSSSSFTPLSLS